MNQESGLIDEVIMIFVDGEVVDVDPVAAVGLASLPLERVAEGRTERRGLALNLQVQQLAGMPGNKRRDRFQFELARLTVAGQYPVAHRNLLHRDIAIVGVNRRVCGKALRAARVNLG